MSAGGDAPASAREASILARAAGWLALAAAALVLVSTLWFFAQSRWPAPARDMWFFMPALERAWAGESVVPSFLEGYGGHRIFFPKLLYLAEFRIFGGRNAFLNACSLLLQAATAWLWIAWSRRASRGLAPPLPALLASLPLALLFSATQMENFVRGWNTHWPFTLAAQVASFAALVRACGASGGRRAAWIAAALGLAAAASLSTLNGLLAFPVLVILAVGLRLPRRATAAVAAVGAVAVALFFAGYRMPPASDPGAAFRDPLALVGWLLRHLGMPASARHAGPGIALGAVAGLAALGFGLDFALRRPGPKTPPLEALALAVLLSGLGTALLTGLGRVGRTHETWDDGRYQTFGMAFWLALLTLALLRVARARRARAALLAAVFLWLALVLAPAHLEQARAIRALATRIRAAQDAIVTGIDDRRAYEASLALIARDPPGPDQVQMYAPFLREHALGMFSPARARLLGRRLGDGLAVSEGGDCRGEILGVHRFAGPASVAIFGSLETRAPAWSRRTLVVTDAGGRVVGIGSTTRFDALRSGGLQGRPGTRDWVAFARAASEKEPLRIWLWAGGDALCPLGGGALRLSAAAGSSSPAPALRAPGSP